MRKRIKNGWSAESPVLGVAAHGYSPEVADENLSRVARLFLAPFERQGTLTEEVTALGLHVTEDGEGLKIVLE